MARKTVELTLHAPKAKRVNLAGNFNNWNTNNITAKKDKQGNWSIRVSLNPGKYEYKFIVDGSWMNDPNCRASVNNSFGSANSVLEVK